METTIPGPDRFRGYANIIRTFLQEMHNTYSDYQSLPFEHPEQQQRTRDWLNWIGPDYRESFSDTCMRFKTEYRDVYHYWEADPAYVLASRKVLAESRGQHPFDTVTERILNAAEKRQWKTVPFYLIRKHTEAGLKWQQALSLAAANFLDGTSYQIEIEARETVSRVSELLNGLERELEKPELAYLSALPEWPAANNLALRYLKGLKRYLDADSLQHSLKRRKDRDLLARVTANELLEANTWAFGKEHKNVVFTLLGLSVFGDMLGLESKTIERLSAKRNDLSIAMRDARVESKLESSDRKRAEMRLYSDPRISNLNR